MLGFSHLLEALVLPPGGLLVIAIAGVVVGRWRPRLGRWLAVTALVGLWLATTPLVAQGLIGGLSTPSRPLASFADSGAGAIVALGGGREHDSVEYGGDTVGAATLVRLRFAAQVARTTGLPLLVSGGRPGGEVTSSAQLMATALADELGVPVRWQEDRSRTTWENAEFSAEVLQAAGLRRIILVTHALHMPRAAAAFERHGFEVVAASTARPDLLANASRLSALLPNSRAAQTVSHAFHELVGRAWYAMRGR